MLEFGKCPISIGLMNKPSTFPRLETEFGVIVQLEVLRGSLVRSMELGAQYLYIEVTAVTDVQEEVLECASSLVAEAEKQEM